MKRLLLLTLILFLLKAAGYSQIISNVYFYTAKDQLIGVKYNISATQSIQYFNVSLWVSIDGGKSFTGPLMHVKGDVGEKIKQGEGKQIFWDSKKEMPGFGGEIVFEVRADVIQKQVDVIQKEEDVVQEPKDKIQKEVERQFFFGYKGSIFAPFGIVLGVSGKPGFYLSARMNSGIFKDALYTTNGESIEGNTNADYCLFTGTDMTQRLSVTAGFQFQLSAATNLYFGGGYTRYVLLWEVDEYNYPSQYVSTAWAKYTEESNSGIELELGLMFHFGHFFLSPGANVQPYRNTDGSIGIGLDGCLGVGVIF